MARRGRKKALCNPTEARSGRSFTVCTVCTDIPPNHPSPRAGPRRLAPLGLPLPAQFKGVVQHLRSLQRQARSFVGISLTIMRRLGGIMRGRWAFRFQRKPPPLLRGHPVPRKKKMMQKQGPRACGQGRLVHELLPLAPGHSRVQLCIAAARFPQACL